MDGDPFLEHLYAHGLAERTIAVYRAAALRWITWCTEHGHDPLQPPPSVLAAYAKTIPETAGSRRQHRVALRHWYTAMGRPDAPLEAIKVPPKRRYYSRALAPWEAAAMKAAAAGWHPHGTAVLLGMYLGIRRTEIAQARWDRFDPELSWYTVTGKFGVTREIAVPKGLAGHLEGLRTYFPYLFPGRGMAHVTPATVSLWVAAVGVEAGVGHVAPHRLRHTAINRVYRVTRDIRVAQEFAGHASSETTEIYTAVTRDMLLEAADALDEPDDLAA